MRKSAQIGEVSCLKSAARDFHGGPVVRTSPSNEGLQVRFPGQGVKIPHVSWPEHQHRKQKLYCKKFNKDFSNGPHQK